MIGIVGTAGVVLSVVFFVVTQNPTMRDVSALGLGMLLGATIAAVVAVSVFHSDERTRRIAEHKALVSRKLKLVAALPTRADEVSRLQAKVIGYNESIPRVQAAGKAQAEVAKDAKYKSFYDDEQTALGEVEALKQTAAGLIEQRESVMVELARIENLSDEQYLAEQKRLRALD